MMNYQELLGIWLLPRGNEGEKEPECTSGKYVTVARALVCIFYSMMNFWRRYNSWQLSVLFTGDHCQCHRTVAVVTTIAWACWPTVDLDAVGNSEFSLSKRRISDLAGVAQWIECLPANQRFISLIPSQGIYLGCRPGPQLGHMRGNHTLMLLSLSFSFLSRLS